MRVKTLLSLSNNVIKHHRVRVGVCVCMYVCHYWRRRRHRQENEHHHYHWKNVFVVKLKYLEGREEGGGGVKQAKVIHFCGGAGRPRDRTVGLEKVGAAHRD